MTFIQDCLSIDAMSWRCINIEVKLYATLPHPRCNVMTLHRHWGNIIYNVASLSMQCHDIALTLQLRCVNVMCQLGCFVIFYTETYFVASHCRWFFFYYFYPQFEKVGCGICWSCSIFEGPASHSVMLKQCMVNIQKFRSPECLTEWHR